MATAVRYAGGDAARPWRRSPGAVVAVAGFCGGTGKTAAAACVARALSEKVLRVLVADLSWHAPALRWQFGLAEGECRGAAALQGGPIEPASRGGVDVLALAGAVSPLPAGAVRGLLSRAREKWDTVVADAGCGCEAEVLDAADALVLSVTQHPHSAELARAGLARSGFPARRAVAVVNRAVPNGAPASAVAGYLGLPRALSVPDNPGAYLRAAAAGVPASALDPAQARAWGAVAEAVLELVDTA